MNSNQYIKNGIESLTTGFNCSILGDLLNFLYGGICGIGDTPSLYHGFMTLAFYQFFITICVFISVCFT